ncbi:tetratricopeptide repeat protein 5 [Leucoraja erinacea]|uniref:tetratricopeptide repeat protein 5 n=1 Tax=Leucoraja erinaceus TaxID=7782 RepID=UPI0024560618|nr:tetratricopeptide repeat protein 5 [Leucoraja erinacea]
MAERGRAAERRGGGEGERSAEERRGEQVEQLYTFRDTFFQTEGPGPGGAEERQRQLQERLHQVLEAISSLEGRSGHKASVLLLRGKALNVLPEGSSEAESALSRAVKLRPELLEAWNQLGEVYWKRGELEAARTCFTGALTHCKNKQSLRNLSMVLRQVQGTAQERAANIMRSVEQARTAVEMDVTDGNSWYVLGNAYLSLFFVSGQSDRVSQQALGAYTQAEKVDASSVNKPRPAPQNRSTLHRYEERYQAALAGLARAAALDPASTEPALREQQLLTYLSRVSTLVQQRGQLKKKRLTALMSSLRGRELHNHQDRLYNAPSGPPTRLALHPLSSLTPGNNPGTAVLGKVVFSLTTEEKVPFTVGLLDGEGTCVAVTVYNMAESWGVLIGDTIAIPRPIYTHHSVEHKDKTFAFGGIRVDSPLLLLVNGRNQSPASQAAPVLAHRPCAE